MKLLRELRAAGVTALAASDGKVALGEPYKTATGQWVVTVGDSASWVGQGDPTPAPPTSLLDTITATVAAHVPDPPPTDEELALRDVQRYVRPLHKVLPADVKAALRAELGL